MIKQFFLVCCFSLFGITFLTAQDAQFFWTTQIEEAISKAQEEDKRILMVFSGSDWCRPCMKFKKEILDTEDFKTYAQKNYVVLYLDFPARKKNRLSKEQTVHNEALAEKYNRSGFFPKVVILNKDEEILGTPSFEGQSPEEYIVQLDKL